MGDQLIISIGRECGSGGHEIANELAKRFGLPVYDNNLLHQIAEERELNIEKLKKYDEKRRNHLFSRNVKGHVNSPEDAVAQMQFDYLRKLAEDGKSFVVVGRCADTVLKDFPCLITMFILADEEDRITHVQLHAKTTRAAAEALCASINKSRKAYHNYYSETKWGDPRTYDICINRSRCGFEETTNILEAYIKSRISVMGKIEIEDE